jgi:hypothetical protein
MDRLRFQIAGPTTDYSTQLTEDAKAGGNLPTTTDLEFFSTQTG